MNDTIIAMLFFMAYTCDHFFFNQVHNSMKFYFWKKEEMIWSCDCNQRKLTKLKRYWTIMHAKIVIFKLLNIVLNKMLILKEKMKNKNSSSISIRKWLFSNCSMYYWANSNIEANMNMKELHYIQHFEKQLVISRLSKIFLKSLLSLFHNGDFSVIEYLRD